MHTKAYTMQTFIAEFMRLSFSLFLHFFWHLFWQALPLNQAIACPFLSPHPDIDMALASTFRLDLHYLNTENIAAILSMGYEN